MGNIKYRCPCGRIHEFGAVKGGKVSHRMTEPKKKEPKRKDVDIFDFLSGDDDVDIVESGEGESEDD